MGGKERRRFTGWWRRLTGARERQRADGLGLGEAEEQLTAVVATPRALTTAHRVAVVSLRGGAGKTTTVLGLATTVAAQRHRSGLAVAAVDADQEAGTLGPRAGEEGHTPMRPLARALSRADDAEHVRDFGTPWRGELMLYAHGTGAAKGQAACDPDDHRRVLAALAPHFGLIVTDTGTGLTHGTARTALELADQVVLVCTPSADGARGADAAVDWLHAHGYGDLARRAIAVVTTLREGDAHAEAAADLADHLRIRCTEAVVVPYDEQLAHGGEFDREALPAHTRCAYLTLAALVTEELPRAGADSAPLGPTRQPPRYTSPVSAAPARQPRWSLARLGASRRAPGLGGPATGVSSPPPPVPVAPGPRSDAPSAPAPPAQPSPPPVTRPPRPCEDTAPAAGAEPEPEPEPEPRSLVAELAQQAAPDRDVPLHVQVVRGGRAGGVVLRWFAVPEEGAALHITVHAPGLVAVDDLQQEVFVPHGADSDVLRFTLRTAEPGLHRVTVRAFRGGTFLGEVHCQISVRDGSVTRDGRRRTVDLSSVAFDPGEVTLQVLKDDATGSYTFQILSEICYAPEPFRFRAGDPHDAAERIYDELRRAAREGGPPLGADTAAVAEDAARLRGRLRNHGVQLWTSAVPEAVQRQFWEQADRISALTVLGEHDIVPWELLYPLNEGREDRGFLAEWLPVVRRTFGQDRVHSMELPGAAFVVPPGSPEEAAREVASLRELLGDSVLDAGVLSDRATLTGLIEAGHAGLLHFACHNAFAGAGSCVTMADGTFDPVDLASAAQLRSLRGTRPLVFFNSCRSAGEIDWFGASLGWAPQFLQAGAGAFVGTLWPVRSESALRFADAFYRELLEEGEPLGRASLHARRAIRDQHGDPTWLAYAVYGSPAATVRPTGPVA